MPLYVFRYNRNVSHLIIFFQVYPPNIRQYIPSIADNLHIILPQICSLFCHKFAHYNDQIYPNLCITMTRFPQSSENTVFCGIQFQISPIILWDVFQFGFYCKFAINSELEYILMWLWIIQFQISPNLCGFRNDL